MIGEPGTGRSALVRALHAASSRRDGPLVEVDVGSVPATLFESDLFGHRSGAFTGAVADRRGRVARADGGSLVLDFVEEMPLDAQPKLLRLLAEGSYSPLGGTERSADVRFFAIASPGLQQRVEQGLFRRDLFHRLDVLRFEIPPLRARRSDLPTIVDHLLEDLAGRFGRAKPALDPAALAWFERYAWPGNLREVRNVLERAMVLSDGGSLSPEAPRGVAEVPRALAEVEREEIVRALAYTRGHQGRAAELLGISRKALWEKRKRHGLP